MEKKNNGLLIAIIILLVLGLIGLGSYIVYDKVINNKEVKEVKEETEQEIKSISFKNELKNKLKYLDNIYGGGKTNNFLYNELTLEKLSEDQKLAVVLNSISRNRTPYYDMDFSSKTRKNYVNEFIRIFDLSKETEYDDIDGMFEVVLDSDVKDRYQELFGTKLEKMINEISSCPMWTHSEPINAYIGNHGCGGTAFPIIITYNNKYTVKGNEAYVYISSGTTQFGSLYTEYSEDLDSLKPYKKLEGDISREDYQKILEENYKDFSEYKATFKKNADGDYYFYSVKRIDK